MGSGSVHLVHRGPPRQHRPLRCRPITPSRFPSLGPGFRFCPSLLMETRPPVASPPEDRRIFSTFNLSKISLAPPRPAACRRFFRRLGFQPDSNLSAITPTGKQANPLASDRRTTPPPTTPP